MVRASWLAQKEEITGAKEILALRPSLAAGWALVCGAWATGEWSWRGLQLFRLAAAWCVADVLLGYALGQMVLLKEILGRAPASPSAVRAVVRFPYAQEGAPGQRLAEALNVRLARWREHLGPPGGHAALAALLGVGLSLVVATYLGREPLVWLGGGLALAAGVFLLAGKNALALARWLGSLRLALALLLGHALLAPVKGIALGLAVLVGLGALARMPWAQPASRPARWLSRAVWAALVGALLWARQPILGLALAAAALAEEVAQGRRPTLRGVNLSFVPGQLGWLLAWLCCAWAVAQGF